jgi:hypothetical protein
VYSSLSILPILAHPRPLLKLEPVYPPIIMAK